MTLSMNCYLDIILEIHIFLLLHSRLDLVNVRRSGPFCLRNQMLVLVNDKITDLKCMEHAIVVFEVKSCVDRSIIIIIIESTCYCKFSTTQRGYNGNEIHQ